VSAFAAVVVSGRLSDYQLLIGSKAFVFTCITLTVVLLTGLSGQVSLMQMSFAGIGAVVIAKAGADTPWLLGLALAAGAAGILGCLVAIPALRLRGIYLALSTLAFAILMDGLVFGNSRLLGGGETLVVPRPSIAGLDVTTERGMFVLAAAAASVFAIIFLAVRRSTLGRLLNAMRDSPTACQMMGVSLARLRLAVFGLSALLAGAAGTLLGALQVRVGALDFLYFRSLTVVLVATIFGITSVSGAVLGAAFFVVLPEALRGLGSEGGGGFDGSLALQPLIIGLLAMSAARHPEGLSGQLRAWGWRQVRRLRPAAPTAVAVGARVGSAAEPVVESQPARVPARA